MEDQEFDNRDDLSAARGCMNACKASILLYSIIFIVWISCSSCVRTPILTKDYGTVVSIGEKYVAVAYDVVNRSGNQWSANFYYKECGHLYQLGDRYPDNDKEVECGW